MANICSRKNATAIFIMVVIQPSVDVELSIKDLIFGRRPYGCLLCVLWRIYANV